MPNDSSPSIKTVSLLAEDSPFVPDAIDGPEIRGGENEIVLTYFAKDETTRVRVTFEGLDSYRVARGEVSPYWSSSDTRRFFPVVEVIGASWLTERHAYEAEHYGDAYEGGRGADTMLVDTHHFLFLFHDGFVEVLARGVRFERPSDASSPPFTFPA